MKPKKIVCLFKVVLASTISIIPLVSCSCFNISYKQYQEYVNYISDHTISIFGKNGLTASIGTAWFAKKLDTHKYRLLTNYHVISKIINSEGMYVNFQTENYDGTGLDFTNYDELTTKTSQSDINAIITNWESNVYMDVSSFDIDFNLLYSSSKWHEKLDKIDSYLNQDNTLLNFYNPQDIVNYNGNVYLAGYPATSQTKPLTKFYSLKTQIYKIDENEKIELSNQQPVYYTYQTNCYMAPIDYSLYKLTGGSSGSLVINDNYECMGIYWGGSLDQYNYFYGSFATFYSQYSTGQSVNVINDLINK